MREYITSHAIANAIRMKRPFFAGVFLVVEGVSDKHVYRLVLDDECCAVEIAHGRGNVLDAVRILNVDGFLGVLGIVDAVDVLERSLRLAYESADLRATKLFQAMTHWQQRTNFTFLKPE